MTTPRTTECRVRYHIVPVFPGISEPGLNAYADRGWRVVAVDGDRVVFEERLDGSAVTTPSSRNAAERRYSPDFEFAVQEYVLEAYRRGLLDGEDKGRDDIEPSREIDEEAIAKVCDELWGIAVPQRPTETPRPVGGES